MSNSNIEQTRRAIVKHVNNTFTRNIIRLIRREPWYAVEVIEKQEE